MAKPSKRRKAVEKRQNGVLTRQRQQERRKAKAAKVADKLLGIRKMTTGRYQTVYDHATGMNKWVCVDHNK